MPRHISQYDNLNRPIVDVGNHELPLSYFNLVRIANGETWSTALEGYESVAVVLSGTCAFRVGEAVFEPVGRRCRLWEGMADSVYVPTGEYLTVKGLTETSEIAIAGGRTSGRFAPFRITPEEVEIVQVGDLKSHASRRICHILGQNAQGRAGNLLVSELFADAGCWAGYPPHKHDCDRPPVETAFEEIYYYRFDPPQGFAAQFIFDDAGEGQVYRTRTGSTVIIDQGYHPSVTAPGYSMYYFTILVGRKGRSLCQYFHPEHEYLTRRIPGVSAMVEKFR